MITFNKFCTDNNIKLETTSNYDLINYAKQLKIKYFRGVFMRDNLANKIRSKDGIVNLEPDSEIGSHWCCYYKINKDKYYFDSFGLNPTNEMLKYLKKGGCLNTFEIQPIGSVICGQLCLYVLYRLSNGSNFINILLDLRNEFS